MLMLPSGPASAVTVPGPAEPSRVQKQITPPLSSKPVEGVAAPAADAPAPAPPGAEKIKFVLETVTIEGMTVHTQTDIAPLYLKMIGSTISLADIYGLAERLTAKYRNEGYILSQAVVPPQTIDNGNITLRVIEGFVDHVVVQSKDPDDAVSLLPYADAIRASRPLNEKALERYLLLINDLPGMTIKSVLSPSPPTPGASDLTLAVEHKSHDLWAGADNRGSRYMGPLQLNTGARLNNALGMHDGLTLQLVTATYDTGAQREMNYAGFGFTRPLGHEGTTINLNGNVSSTAPGYLLKPLNVTGVSHTYNVEVMHPFIRSRGTNLSATLKFNYLDTVRGDNLGLGDTEDRIRTLRLSGAFQRGDAYGGVSTLNGELSHGLNVLNSKPQGSQNMTRVNGDPEFFKATAEVSRVQNLSDHFDLFGSATGQWSASPLLASEEFGVGGAAYGSAYDSSEITGKNGLAGRIELRDNNPVTSNLRALQVYGFYDIGKVWDPQNAAANARILSLSSAGVGFRSMLNDAVSCSAELAAPLSRKVGTENNTNPRLFFALMARF